MEYMKNLGNRCVNTYRKTILLTLMLGATLMLLQAGASAQTYNVLYNFTGSVDGANPAAGVTLDRGGNLYGTTAAGGSTNCSNNGVSGCGTVFELVHNRRGGWNFTPIYKFTGNDGANPLARVVFGAGGTLYGTTSQGGTAGFGQVFQLLPPVHVCTTPSCLWSENVLYAFQSSQAGENPGAGDLVFDSFGDIYGTTIHGGGLLCDDEPCGTAFKLHRFENFWYEDDYVPFNGLAHQPLAGVVLDRSGNVFGTAPITNGGIYEVSQSVPNLLYTFPAAASPIGGLILDPSATHLYGTTSQGGSLGGGTIFQFSLGGSNPTTLYNFSGPNNSASGPTATLLMDAAGNLYGTTHIDGAHLQGMVFELSQSNGVWTLTDLHDFTGGTDGGQPFGQLTMDANGNLYGTTTIGGSSQGQCYLGLGCGVVFEITP